MAKTTRDVMSGGVECVGENDSVLDAVRDPSYGYLGFRREPPDAGRLGNHLRLLP
jgi:hypothetical protein